MVTVVAPMAVLQWINFWRRHFDLTPLDRIKKGHTHSMFSCPVAMSLTGERDDGVRIKAFVNGCAAWMGPCGIGKFERVLAIPPVVRDFIRRVDDAGRGHIYRDVTVQIGEYPETPEKTPGNTLDQAVSYTTLHI
jgi:hypothetical protein